MVGSGGDSGGGPHLGCPPPKMNMLLREVVWK